MVLTNGEFEFRSLKFGKRSSGYWLKQGGFTVGPTTFTVQDQPNPIGDGFLYGRDTRQGMTYSWDLWVSSEESESGWREVSRRLSTFRKTWLGSANRKIPRAVDELKLWHGNEVGLVYGRARNHAEDRGTIRRGFAGILCDFLSVDDLVYSDVLESHTLNLIESTEGGFIAPFVFPLIGASEGNSRAGFFEVLGDAPTPAIVRFHGPISNPKLVVAGQWVVGLSDSLAYDEWVEIDTRLWKRSVTTQSGGSAAGSLSGTSWPLEKLVLAPGMREMVFTGVDPTNTSSVTVSWRKARYSV